VESYIASPLSRRDIRRYVNKIRGILNIGDNSRLPIVKFLEFIMPFIDKEFTFVVKTKEEMGNCHGLTHPDKHLIEIREDVYKRACDGVGRDRFTIAHEIGHYLLHEPNRVALARVEDKAKIPIYQTPEWQADVFAGELLMPAHLIKGKTPEEVSILCQVSLSAARTQLSKI
jgi:Zn-dependent peptidase ImmA (M78 family)